MEGTWETSVLLAAQLVGMSIVAQLWLRLRAPGILKVDKKRKEGVLDVLVNFSTIFTIRSQVGREPTQSRFVQ